MSRNAILSRRARALRNAMTSPERQVWAVLRQLNRVGCHFRRQVPIGPYIVDFAWISLGLVVEIDGEGHTTAEAQAADLRRDQTLAAAGYAVVRIWNVDALGNPDGTGERLLREVNRLLAARDLPSIDWDGVVER